MMQWKIVLKITSHNKSNSESIYLCICPFYQCGVLRRSLFAIVLGEHSSDWVIVQLEKPFHWVYCIAPLSHH